MQNRSPALRMEDCEDDGPLLFADSQEMAETSQAFTIACDRCLYEMSNGRLFSSQEPHTCEGGPPSPQHDPPFVPPPRVPNPWGDDDSYDGGASHVSASVASTLFVASEGSLEEANEANTSLVGAKRPRDEDQPVDDEEGELEKAMGKVVVELGRVCMATVYTTEDLEEKIDSRTLPNKPFHTILRFRVEGRVYYAHAYLGPDHVLTARCTSRALQDYVYDAACELCDSLGQIFGSDHRVVTRCYEEWCGNSAGASVTHLSQAIGSCLVFNVESILAAGASKEKEEKEWHTWVDTFVFKAVLPEDGANENASRLARVMRGVADSILNHVGGDGAEEVRSAIESAFGDVVELVYDCYQESCFEMVLPLLVTTPWVATLCSRLPLDSGAITDNTPPYKLAWYTMMANTDPNIYHEF